MADSIRLRAGKKVGMPQLADREPAYVRDEQAIYMGTPEGNVKLAAAGTESRVTALERLAAAHGETLNTHTERLTNQQELLDTHSELLESVEGIQQTHGETLNTHTERLAAQQELLDTHGELLESMKGVQQTHGESLSACGETLNTHEAVLQRLDAEKLSAVPMAVLPELAEGAEAAAVIAAYNALLAALQAAGLMNT